MNRLDRYIFSETLGPLGLGLLVYTFILFMRFFFASAELIIRRGLPVAMVGKLLALNLPHIVVLTIPMALLFAILIAIGRLAADSELVAMRSCGISLFSLYRPILVLSTLLCAATMLLMIFVLPRGNHALQMLQLDILSRSISQQVQPRVFYEEWEGKILYVHAIPSEEKRWRGVFLSEALPRTENEVTVAEWGEVRVDGAGERVVLHLTNAVTHKVDFSRPEKYEIRQHRNLEVLLEDRFLSQRRARMVRSKGVRELTMTELRQWAEDPQRSPELRNQARVQIHKSFAIPFACMVFGLFAVPLGFNNRRGGKGSGFALSLVVIVFYYVVINNGEEAARMGRMPAWLAMWLPNILLTAAGAFLLARRNRDKSLMLSHLDRWIRDHFWRKLRLLQNWRQSRRRDRRRNQARSIAPDLVLRLPRPRLRFPNIIDRYVIRLFTVVFLLVLVAAMTIILLADLSETVEEVLKNNVARRIVIDYYKYLSLQIAYEVAPVAVLITTLVTFGLLSRSNEITALKALGISLYRLSLPTLAAALVITIGAGILESTILPASNGRLAQLKDVIRGRVTARTYRRADRQWVAGRGGHIFNYLRYDPREQTLQRLQVFRFNSQYQLTGRLWSDRAQYVDGHWQISDSWARSFNQARVTDFRRVPDTRPVDMEANPENFDSLVRRPEQMDYWELESYITELRDSGQAVPELEVQLHNKIAFPVVTFVMALVALPFAFRLGRRGALYGIGIAIVLGMTYYAAFALFTTLGETAALPPLVAVWSPNALFAILSLYQFLGIQS